MSDEQIAANTIASGRIVEALWGAHRDPDRALDGAQDMVSKSATNALKDFCNSISAVECAKDPDLRRLARFATDVRASITLRELIAILTPFERWSERSLRDDEFLVSNVDQAASQLQRSLPIAALLDCLRSSFNVGAIFRAAECVGAQHIALSGYTAPPTSLGAGRAAMGTNTIVPWSAHARFADAASALRADNYALIALETSAKATDLYQMRWPERCAFVLGNERFGLGREALAGVDVICRIPMYGLKNSLNVASAFAIAAFERARAYAV